MSLPRADELYDIYDRAEFPPEEPPDDGEYEENEENIV